MFRKQILLAIGVLVLVTLACGVSIDVPIKTDIKTGPTVTDDIMVPSPSGKDTTSFVTLGFGAGEMYLSPGADGALIQGTADYNINDLKPDINISGDTVRIENGSLEINGIPNFKEQVKNIWDLKFGDSPIDLTIKAGAYLGQFELGGLALTSLHVADGASDVNVNFAVPNLIEMQSLHYETGASDITLNHLANANFTTMIFESGAGNYELDFSGALQRDATVFIETGLSSMTVIVPENANVRLTVNGGLTNISTRGNWEQSGNSYLINGEGPTLTISVDMSAGSLILRSQ